MLVKLHHPDTGSQPDVARIVELNAAWKQLGTLKARTATDAKLLRERGPTSGPVKSDSAAARKMQTPSSGISGWGEPTAQPQQANQRPTPPPPSPSDTPLVYSTAPKSPISQPILTLPQRTVYKGSASLVIIKMLTLTVIVPAIVCAAVAQAYRSGVLQDVDIFSACRVDSVSLGDAWRALITRRLQGCPVPDSANTWRGFAAVAGWLAIAGIAYHAAITLRDDWPLKRPSTQRAIAAHECRAARPDRLGWLATLVMPGGYPCLIGVYGVLVQPSSAYSADERFLVNLFALGFVVMALIWVWVVWHSVRRGISRRVLRVYGIR